MILSNPSTSVLLLGLCATVAYAIPALGAQRLSTRTAQAVLALAWVLHACLLATEVLGLGQEHGARFGFAPVLSVTAWLMLTIYAVESQIFPQMQARWALAGLGGCAIVLSLLYPGHDLQAHTHSPWMALHWALGSACYGLFTAAVIHAAILTRAERRMRQGLTSSGSLPLLTLERLTFRFVGAGFAVLSATLLAGWWFSEILYHQAWQWNHKTVFSLLAWAVFACLLTGRVRFGWRGKHAVRMLYAGSVLLLLAYAGSRFVLEVLLQRPNP